MRSNRNNNIGTVIHGTMRAEDLIPAFIDALRSQRPLDRATRKELRGIDRAMARKDYFDTEDSMHDLEALFYMLDTFAPEGFYFGSHPGDGSDYGFWLSDYFVEEFDGLKVDCLSAVPRGYSGSVLHINERGNTTLYFYTRGRGREQWALV